MRIISWNINSVRLRIRSVSRVLSQHQPDVLCLQEIKCVNELFPSEGFRKLGYVHQLISGQKAYHGVAIVSRIPLGETRVKAWCQRSDCRHVFATLPGGIELHNVYAPAGGDLPDPDKNPKFAHKLQFFRDMTRWFRRRGVNGTGGILVGDLNIAPLPNDVWSHKQLLRVVTHTPVEIAALEKLRASADWVDAGRLFVPASEKLYTWWSYRAPDWKRANKGRRLDHAWVTAKLRERVLAVNVLDRVRGWKLPSDHVPVQIDLDL